MRERFLARGRVVSASPPGMVGGGGAALVWTGLPNLGLKNAAEDFEVVARYCPKERVPAKTRFLVEEILDESRPS